MNRSKKNAEKLRLNIRVSIVIVTSKNILFVQLILIFIIAVGSQQACTEKEASINEKMTMYSRYHHYAF